MADKPTLVVAPEQLASVEPIGHMHPIPPSRMFEIRDALQVYRASAGDVEVFDASQGDGGASLEGVSAELLAQALSLQSQRGTGYDQPYGTDLFRRAVVEDYWQLGSASGWGTGNVIACQGGRDALLKAYDAMQTLGHRRRGDFVVTSAVPWVSYNWGPYGIGANTLLAPGDPRAAWALTPDGIRECVRYAAHLGGRRVAGLIITSPDNPTGRDLAVTEQVRLAHSAFELGIPFVIFDWIYHQVTDEQPYDVNELLEAFAPAERERCLVLDGLTKALGASNIRNAHLLAGEPVIRAVQARASHGVIPSFYSQAVAVAAYRRGRRAFSPIVEPTNESRKQVRAVLEERQLNYVIGQGYYAFIDVGPWIDRVGLRDSADLGSQLAQRFGLAVVPGVYFSRDAERWIRFSYALAPDKARRAIERLTEALAAL